jgi:hypothetical protein
MRTLPGLAKHSFNTVCSSQSRRGLLSKHLARTVHDLYFQPKYQEFRPRTIWSLTNAFTSAFTDLEPIPQFRATPSSENSWNRGSRNRYRRFVAVPAGPSPGCVYREWAAHANFSFAL